jgi:hypothetical protein
MKINLKLWGKIKTLSLDRDDHQDYLVDMAKAEALDAMGDNEAATQIAERYL